LERSSSWLSPSSEICTWIAVPSSLIMSGRWVSYHVTTEEVVPSGMSARASSTAVRNSGESAAWSSLE
jgi:hypothetical protein